MQISKSLDEINDERVEKVNRLKIAERERDNLSGSKTEAEAFVEKEKNVRRKKNALYQVYQHRAVKNASDFTVRFEKASEKLAYERAKIKDSEAKLLDMEKSFNSANKEYQSVESSLSKAKLVSLYICHYKRFL